MSSVRSSDMVVNGRKPHPPDGSRQEATPTYLIDVETTLTFW